MSWQEKVPNPERYAPGSPWSTHEWGDDPFWGDSCSFCVTCGTPSFKDEAHEPCQGPGAAANHSMPSAVLVRPKAGMRAVTA
ncbi:hypothetical protein [Streptomyces violaceusniger]|uniref:Uncharacterized protein n=1 Tax=Streptomyces violaceusniger (strain Tu 4113) TaxID=653045 RepID=G2P7B0_STRV4|nr:hypothetical protein [Streptomyces violaceusniger]AEM87070.1 hypothetical protein Strvi_7735 [Streptomyces violaceusniger Tu 4113]